MKTINALCVFLYCRMKAFVKEERGAVDIVAIVVLIGIAVVLAATFRREIEGLLNTLFSGISDKAKEATS